MRSFSASPDPIANDRQHRPRGQSLVEFALVLPLLILLLLTVVDFGRAYMGWVQLNNAARVAANYAALHPDAWGVPGNAVEQANYATLITNDSAGANCASPITPPAPTFPGGTTIGAPARVDLSCSFRLLVTSLPGFGQILPNPMTLPATASFPVRAGTLDVVPASCTGTKPTAVISPSIASGVAPLAVTFTDASTGSPTSWSWSFGDDVTASGPGPFTHTYTSAGTFPAVLTVGNACGFSSASTTITVSDALTADFVGDPLLGHKPLQVAFTDKSVGGPTSWAWDFGDGGSSAAQNPSHTYSANGVYTVTLTISNGTATASAKKTTYVEVGCVVPNFADVHLSDAQSVWTGAGFPASSLTKVGSGNSKIKSQSVPGGTVDSTCAIAITVTAP